MRGRPAPLADGADTVHMGLDVVGLLPGREVEARGDEDRSFDEVPVVLGGVGVGRAADQQFHAHARRVELCRIPRLDLPMPSDDRTDAAPYLRAVRDALLAAGEMG